MLYEVITIPLGWKVLEPYQKERVLTLLSPEKDPLGAGYHIRHRHQWNILDCTSYRRHIDHCFPLDIELQLGPGSGGYKRHRITSYNVCYTKLLRSLLIIGRSTLCWFLTKWMSFSVARNLDCLGFTGLLIPLGPSAYPCSRRKSITFLVIR